MYAQISREQIVGFFIGVAERFDKDIWKGMKRAPVKVKGIMQPEDKLIRILVELAEACGHKAALWRGPRLDGRDIDVLVCESDSARVLHVLLRADMKPANASGVWGAWVHSDESMPPIDLMPACHWPSRYPPVQGVIARIIQQWPLPIIAAEDRLLVFASDALAGRQLDKLQAHIERTLVEDPGVRSRFRALAERERLISLARLVNSLEHGRYGGGRLPFSAACRIGAQSRAGRRALRDRLLKRLIRRSKRALATVQSEIMRQQSPAPLLITVSGMDGSGKTTLAAELERHLVAMGIPAKASWARLGNEREVLEAIALPVKRLLRRSGTIADPIAVTGPGGAQHQNLRTAVGDRGLVEWGWALFVAMVSTRTYRQRADLRKRGRSLVSDRWTADALVDLELRYGVHRLAACLVRRLVPRADLALLLEVDAVTAGTRNPGDKAHHTLEQMESLYAAQARELSLIRLDATLPAEQVAAQACLLVDALIAQR